MGTTIYIVDGDFDRILYDSDMIDDLRFIYLKEYNIENYLIDKDVTLKFAKGRLHKLDEEVERIVDFEGWREKIVQQATKLFLCYCLVQKEVPSEPNVARSHYLFLDDKTGFEKEGKYQEYWDRVNELIPNASGKIDDIKRKYENIYGEDYYSLICGKFLLTSLICHIKSVTGARPTINNDDFKWQLVCNCNLDRLFFIKERIHSLLDS